MAPCSIALRRSRGRTSGATKRPGACPGPAAHFNGSSVASCIRYGPLPCPFRVNTGTQGGKKRQSRRRWRPPICNNRRKMP